MARTRPSAAQMQRERAAALAERESAVVTLPDAFTTYLAASYTPRADIRASWLLVRPLVQECLERSGLTGVESLKKHVTHLAHFWTWAHRHGLAMDVHATLTRRCVDEYARVGMPDGTDKSRTDRRSRLRNLADRVNPDHAGPKPVVIPRNHMRPPYSPAEMVVIRRVAQVQPTATFRRQMCLCVGLGAGAGLDSADIKTLYGRHVHDGDDGITVEVGNPARSRTTTVLREYEDLVRIGVAGIDAETLPLGHLPGRHNVAAKVFEKATVIGRDIPHLEQSRLRSTWIATLLQRPIPLGVILAAAGLTSARTVVEIARYLDAAATTDAAALREGGQR